MSQSTPTSLFLAGTDVISVENIKTPTPTRSYHRRPVQKSKYQLQIVWKNVIGFIVLHLLALYGLVYGVQAAKRGTMVFSK